MKADNFFNIIYFYYTLSRADVNGFSYFRIKRRRPRRNALLGYSFFSDASSVSCLFLAAVSALAFSRSLYILSRVFLSML